MTLGVRSPDQGLALLSSGLLIWNSPEHFLVLLLSPIGEYGENSMFKRSVQPIAGHCGRTVPCCTAGGGGGGARECTPSRPPARVNILESKIRFLITMFYTAVSFQN